MQDQLKWFFVLHSLEIIFSFLIKMSLLEAQKNLHFSSPWEFKHLHVGLFLLCLKYPSYFPLQTGTYIDYFVEIFLKFSTKSSRGTFSYWDHFSPLSYQHSFQIFGILKTRVYTRNRLGFLGGADFIFDPLTSISCHGKISGDINSTIILKMQKAQV